jgi:uncharacterized protein YaeQ
VYTYQSSPERWWEPIKNKLHKEKNLEVWCIRPDCAEKLANFANRSMSLQYSVQDGDIWVRNDNGDQVQIEIEAYK